MSTDPIPPRALEQTPLRSNHVRHKFLTKASLQIINAALEIVTLSRNQFCVIRNPWDNVNKPQMGKLELRSSPPSPPALCALSFELTIDQKPANTSPLQHSVRTRLSLQSIKNLPTGKINQGHPTSNIQPLSSVGGCTSILG